MSIASLKSFLEKENSMEYDQDENLSDIKSINIDEYALGNGDFYKGEYNDRGLRHGYGHYVFKNGAQYIGYYRRGLKDGVGKTCYSDGSSYDGDWKSNFKHGRGIYNYKNGDCYDGEWMKDKRHGYGQYYFADNGCLFRGIWQNGCRAGAAEILSSNFRFIGTWNDKFAIGPGVFALDNKLMNIGYFDEIYDKAIEDGALIGNKWITQEITHYDSKRLPMQPENTVIDPDILRTVSEVDNVTDYLVDSVFHKINIIEFNENLIELCFTKTEMKSIANLIIQNATNASPADDINGTDI